MSGLIDLGGTLFVCGLVEEAKLLGRYLGPNTRRVILGPSAPQRALTLARAMVGASRLISFGYGGGLCPGLQSGALLLGEAVVDHAGRTIPASSALRASLATALPSAQAGLIYGVDQPLLARSARQVAAVKTQASLVDMESHLVAALAQEADMDWAALRVVFDPAEADLPPAIERVIGPGGGLRPLGLLQPGLWPKLPALIRQHQAARASLQSALENIAPLFSGR